MSASSDSIPTSIARLDQPSAARSIISVLLFAHLFCVVVVLGSNFRRSPLQNRLVSFFAAYTRALNFDPNFTPFHLTGGTVADDDHLLEVELVDGPDAGQKFSLPYDRGAWLDQRRRFMAINNLMGSQAQNLIDEQQDISDEMASQVTAELAKAIGGYFLVQHGGTRCVVRCTRRMSQPIDPSALPSTYPRDNPTAPEYHTVIYTADVIRGVDGQLLATRRQGRRDVAPVKTTK